MTRRTAECANCHRVLQINARQLCSACYKRQWRAGGLDDYPTLTPRHHAGDLIEDVEWLISSGADAAEAARRLGYNSPPKVGLYRALHRAGRLDLWRQLQQRRVA